MNLTLIWRRGKGKKDLPTWLSGGVGSSRGKECRNGRGLRELRNLQASVNYGEVSSTKGNWVIDRS